MIDDSREPPAIDDATIPDDAAEEHPAVETLLAYHRRELETSAAEGLREHLSDCVACADLVLDLAKYGLWPDRARLLTEEELTAERRRLTQLLAKLRDERV